MIKPVHIDTSAEFSLALGGGAARGLAHIGLIERLEELGVRPKYISGTSMGAIIAAFYACGYTAAEMKKIVDEIKMVKLVDFDFLHGIFEGKKLVREFKKYFSDITFEDLEIPLTIVATNIDTGEKIYFRTGKILDAIRASMSIPGVFAPFRYTRGTSEKGSSYLTESSLMNLVDGGLVENLPIEALPENIPVLAASVQIGARGVWDGKKGNMFFTNGTIFSNSYSILRKTVAIMMAQNEKHSMNSRSNVQLFQFSDTEIDYYEFGKHAELITLGYKQAKQEIG